MKRSRLLLALATLVALLTVWGLRHLRPGTGLPARVQEGSPGGVASGAPAVEDRSSPPRRVPVASSAAAPSDADRLVVAVREADGSDVPEGWFAWPVPATPDECATAAIVDGRVVVEGAQASTLESFLASGRHPRVVAGGAVAEPDLVLRSDEEGLDWEVLLAPLGDLALRVLDTLGNPLAGAEVWVGVRPPAGAAPGALTARDGRVRVRASGSRASRCWVRAEGCRFGAYSLEPMSGEYVVRVPRWVGYVVVFDRRFLHFALETARPGDGFLREPTPPSAFASLADRIAARIPLEEYEDLHWSVWPDWDPESPPLPSRSRQSPNSVASGSPCRSCR